MYVLRNLNTSKWKYFSYPKFDGRTQVIPLQCQFSLSMCSFGLTLDITLICWILDEDQAICHDTSLAISSSTVICLMFLTKKKKAGKLIVGRQLPSWFWTVLMDILSCVIRSYDKQWFVTTRHPCCMEWCWGFTAQFFLFDGAVNWLRMPTCLSAAVFRWVSL